MTIGRGYLFQDNSQFVSYDYSIGKLGDEEVLLRMKVSTICGSDIHTYKGDRSLPTPINLGHEGVGIIERLGQNIKVDAMGRELSEGDAILFLPYIWCNKCLYCLRGDKTNCKNRISIGSIPFRQEKPSPTGTFSEYLVLPKGVEFIKIEENVSDLLSIAPINCSLSTMFHAFSDRLPKINGRVLAVLGMGALGLYSSAIASYSGAQKVIAIDKNPERLKLAKTFGATDIIETTHLKLGEIHRSIEELTDGRGVDIVTDVSGYPPLVEDVIKSLDKRGTFLEIGTIFPAIIDGISLDEFVKKGISFSGMRTYEIRHLFEAYNFFLKTRKRFPFEAITGKTFDNADIGEAFKTAKNGKYVRVGITW